jgi:hypothetical protein
MYIPVIVLLITLSIACCTHAASHSLRRKQSKSDLSASHSYQRTQGNANRSIDIPDLFFGEQRQDKWLLENVFPHLTNGIFIEAGAFDGIRGSNAVFFERYRNWRGVCVEPNSKNFQLVQQRRSCRPINAALCGVDGEATFVELGRPRDQESGILEQMEGWKRDLVKGYIK